jgi:RNA polymerase sigma-70 factor (ECF subfamily)
MPKFTKNLSQLLSLSDEKAMIRVRDHDDHAAFALLVRRWEGPIRRLCVRMMTDAQRGEDLAQETFARLFQKRRSYKPQSKFSTYLWRVAMNRCYDELRKARRQRASDHVELDDGADGKLALSCDGDTPHQATAREEEAAMVREALAKLPDHYRSVLILRHYEGLKLREIAEVLEIPPGTVNSRMAEALTRLSRSLLPKLSADRHAAAAPLASPAASTRNSDSPGTSFSALAVLA